VEPLDRAVQPDVALLDHVQQRHAEALVAAGYRHYEPQVGFDQGAVGRARDPALVRLPVGGSRLPNLLRVLLLLERSEQRVAPDLLQVQRDDRLGALSLARQRRGSTGGRQQRRRGWAHAGTPPERGGGIIPCRW